MSKFDSYIICTSPRSGSTLLCQLLTATGVAGIPASYFHRPSVSRWLSYFKLTTDVSTPERKVLGSIFQAAITEGTGDTAMFALRMQGHSFKYFSEKLAVLHSELSSDAQRLQAVFGRTAFLYLTRDDKVEQAVSYVKAEQSGLWHTASDGTELERLSAPQPLVYDAARIKTFIEQARTQDREWSSWFSSEQIEPFSIRYEALSADPVKTLNDVLEYLGLSYKGSSNIQPGIAKMADKVSQEWVALYRSQL